MTTDFTALRRALGVERDPLPDGAFTVTDILPKEPDGIKVTAVRTRLAKAVAQGLIVQVRPARGHIDAVYALAKGVTPAMVGELFVEAPKPNGRKRTRRLYPRHAADGVGRARDVRG